MSNKYVKLLKVGNANGQRIKADVYVVGDTRIIHVEYLKEVEADNPRFAHKGAISMTVDHSLYRDAISTIESYIENLFLKGLDNATDVHSSTGTGVDSGGNEESDSKGNAGEDKREGDSPSIHSSPRRKKPTKSTGRGDEAVTVDESRSEEISE